jgi:hypothetical protein
MARDGPAPDAGGSLWRLTVAMNARAWMAVAAILIAVPCAAQTQQVVQTPPDYPRGRISGYVFGDYYYNVAGDPIHRYNAAGSDSAKTNIDASRAQQIGKDLNGFQVRRIYFQLDNDLSVKVATRFRLEADSKSLTSDGKLGVNVKAAYVQVKSAYRRADVFAGILTTPIWENVEEFWGYRSIEKTIADFRGLGSSADLGAEVKGGFDTDRHVGYYLMIGNGIGQKPEDNRYKKFYVGFPAKFGDFRIEPYIDYETQFAGKERVTYKGWAGYEFKKGVLGMEVVDRLNHGRPINQEPFGLSFFGRVAPRTELAAFGRVDLWSDDRRLDNRVDSQLYIAGIDWQPFRDVHFMPNLEYQRFDAKGTAVAPTHNEMQARITFYYRYSKPQSS